LVILQNNKTKGMFRRIKIL
jgi:hypothetical protein